MTLQTYRTIRDLAYSVQPLIPNPDFMAIAFVLWVVVVVGRAVIWITGNT